LLVARSSIALFSHCYPHAQWCVPRMHLVRGSSSVRRPPYHWSHGTQQVLGCIFYGYASLRRITIPSTVAVITRWAFDGCNSLEEVRLHEGLQAIEKLAFARCSSLKHIFIPSTVTSIENWTFDECWPLKVLHLRNSRLSATFPAQYIVLRTNIQSTVAYAECGGLCLRVDSSVTNIPDSSHLHLKTFTR
jgi:hypothetical protein